MIWDVLVVGGGVLGTFHALFAAEQGWKTLLIERHDTPRGASVRNFGMVIAGAMEPGPWRDRALESQRIYRDLAGRVPIPLVRQGILYAGGTAAETQVLEEFSALAPDLGYRCRLLDTEQAVAAHPALKKSYARKALLFDDDFTLDSRTLFRTLHPWMTEQLGCTVLTGTRAVRVERAAGRCEILTSDGRTLLARRVIVCCGNEQQTLFPALLASRGLRSCKLQMLRTVAQPGERWSHALALGLSLRRYGAFTLAPSYAQLAHEEIDPFLEQNGIHVLLTQNPAGEVIIGDSHHMVDGQEEHDEQLDMRIDQAILAYAQSAVQIPTWDIATRWYGTYATHPDDQYLHEVVDEWIHVVTGIGGRGMTCGPALARAHIAALHQELRM